MTEYNPIEIARQYAPKFDKPVVDMVAVVRCKDCKFYNPHVRECEGIGNWFGLEDVWGDNDFCSKGERRDEVEE